MVLDNNFAVGPWSCAQEGNPKSIFYLDICLRILYKLYRNGLGNRVRFWLTLDRSEETMGKVHQDDRKTVKFGSRPHMLYIIHECSPYIALSMSPWREPNKERANQTHDQIHTTHSLGTFCVIHRIFFNPVLAGVSEFWYWIFERSVR